MLFDQFVDKVLVSTIIGVLNRWLASVLSQVLISSVLPFKLGHGVMQELADEFLLYNHSVHRVSRGLRVNSPNGQFAAGRHTDIFLFPLGSYA